MREEQQEEQRTDIIRSNHHHAERDIDSPSSAFAMKSLASGKHTNLAPACAARLTTERQTRKFHCTLLREHICPTAASTIDGNCRNSVGSERRV